MTPPKPAIIAQRTKQKSFTRRAGTPMALAASRLPPVARIQLPRLDAAIMPAAARLPADPGLADPALDTKVTVRLTDAPLSAYLASLSRQTGLKFSAGAALEGERVSARLSGRPVREALLERVVREHMPSNSVSQFAAEIAEHKRDPYALVEQLVGALK